MILLPDQYQAAVYKKDVGPNLKPGAAWPSPTASTSTHGYIKPSGGSPGVHGCPRRARATSFVVVTPLAVASRSSLLLSRTRTARPAAVCLAHAKALGALRAGAIKTTFTEETGPICSVSRTSSWAASTTCATSASTC